MCSRVDLVVLQRGEVLATGEMDRTYSSSSEP